MLPLCCPLRCFDILRFLGQCSAVHLTPSGLVTSQKLKVLARPFGSPQVGIADRLPSKRLTIPSLSGTIQSAVTGQVPAGDRSLVTLVGVTATNIAKVLDMWPKCWHVPSGHKQVEWVCGII